MKKQFQLVVGILILVLFISAHFLIGMYFNSPDRPFYFWILADIFLYLAIVLHIFYIVNIAFSE